MTIANRGALGTAKLVLRPTSPNALSIRIDFNDGDNTPFTISNGFDSANGRPVHFSGTNNLTFSNCTQTSVIIEGGQGFTFNNPKTIFTGAPGSPGEISIRAGATFSLGGTGKVEFDVACIPAVGQTPNLVVYNINEVYFTDQAANSTYKGYFAVSALEGTIAVARVTTLNNDSTNGVFGNSTLPVYLASDGPTAGNHQAARLIYDSPLDGSTNKNFSIGPTGGRGTVYLEAANTGRFEITGNIGYYKNNAQTLGGLNLVGTGNGRIAGVISNNLTSDIATDTAFLAVVKNGTGTWVLDGDNTYVGKTTVTAGTLIINGNNSDSKTAAGGYFNTNDGHYQVQVGATLGGSGNISGKNADNNSNLVYVAVGGILAPGAAAGQVGTLTLDAQGLTGASNVKALKMVTGAKFSFDLAGNLADRIAFWGFKGADKSSSSVVFNATVIDLNLLGGIATNEDKYYEVAIFTFYSDGGTTSATHYFNTGDLMIGSYDDERIANPTIFYNAGAGYISLSYTVLAIPEPATWALLGVSLLVVTVLRRKKNLQPFLATKSTKKHKNFTAEQPV